MPIAQRSAAAAGAPASKPTEITTARMSLLLAGLLALAALVSLLAPGIAGASSRQLSLMQDDRELYGELGDNPAAAMAEMRELGVDVIRTNVLFYRTYTAPAERRKPRGFVTSDPNSPRYNWGPTDNVVRLARENGIRVMLTVSGPGPFWASEQASRCRRVPCTLRPKPAEFGAFVAAAAKRYRGQVDFYSLYNEPNLFRWITPEVSRVRGLGTIETAAIYYRKLWRAGYASVAKYDRARRNRVLFGEVAAIGKPLPLLNAALCLNPSSGRKLTGRLARAYGCSGRPAKLNIAGIAIHPYNQGAFGTPRTKTGTKSSLPLAYMPRLYRLADRAVRARRMGSAGRSIYVTEFGFQSNPPDRNSNVSLAKQAQYINESDRLFFSASRVKTVAQYELVDVPQAAEFNSGLRTAGTRAEKPAYAAYRLPIVVTRRSASSVEVYGQVRRRRLLGSAQPSVQVNTGAGFTTVAQPFTNSVGIFRINLRQSPRATYRLLWTDPRNGQTLTSRTATAGKALRFYRN